MTNPRDDGSATTDPDSNEHSEAKKDSDGTKADGTKADGTKADDTSDGTKGADGTKSPDGTSDGTKGAEAEKGSGAKNGSKRRSPEERLTALTEKRDQLTKRIDGLTTVARTMARKMDTRRKIIVGALVLNAAAHNEKTRASIRAQIDKNVKSDRDRELFADLLK